MPKGYYRFPTIHEDTVIFVCDDDLWSVSGQGGIARRLTSNLGMVTRPWISPDGSQVAFVGREEGQPEIYIMPILGGQARRLTYMGSTLTLTAGWTDDGKILFASNAGHWYLRFTHLYELDPKGGSPVRYNLGPARAISYGPRKGVVIGRNTDDPARWKRYRGGTVGQIWIDLNGERDFHPLVELSSNLASPMWLPGSEPNGRVYFISDHEGIGNLYSILPTGNDLLRHTHHDDFYVRNATTDGKNIVYHAGADLFIYDPESDQSKMIAVAFHSPQTQRNRKFIDASRYLQDWKIHPNGQSLAATSRGKLYTFANWEGPVWQHGYVDEPAEKEELYTAVRYRIPRWLNDGKRLIAVTDEGGEERFILFHYDGSEPARLLPEIDIGRPEMVMVNPTKDQIAFSNHRYELMSLDLSTYELQIIDRSRASSISGISWSPDGEWLVYSVSVSLQIQALKLWKASTGEIFPLTRPLLRDVDPVFDTTGKYIYFLSYRTFDPVYDNLHFDLSFPLGMKPYLITLQASQMNPFIPQPRFTSNEDKKDKADTTDEQSTATLPNHIEEKEQQENGEKTADQPGERDNKSLTQIDLDGIQDRIIAFPVDEGIYGRILGALDNKVVYSRFPVESALDQESLRGIPIAKGTLFVYNLEDQNDELLANRITDFDMTPDGKYLIYRSGNDLRVIKGVEKPTENGERANRKNGWLDLNRLRVSVLPGAEWRQMFREAWRLQRDQFWTPDMSQVDWVDVHNRYLPLVDRLSCRSEFSDLMWEMQGELGTSHAYEFGGDYRPEPSYLQGFLGADFTYDPGKESWQISRIYHGDPWNPLADSPLCQPGINLKTGDYLLAINGRRLSSLLSPAAALIHLAGEEVTLSVLKNEPDIENLPSDKQGTDLTVTITVKTLTNEMPVRYRSWVENNRQYVHQHTNGRIGYVHIPDMGGWGYAEFHRGYLSELDRQGLIVDVRYNRGGHVSALILEKLARRRLGYDQSRWSLELQPYPPDSIIGPIVALTNEFTASDGDIFSHGFKLLKIGTVLGTRTWGGVIGISPRHSLTDGTLTTQPEFSFWFQDVGWGVENYGTDPDIYIDNKPQDYFLENDAQLDRAIQEILIILEANPPSLPDLNERPSRALPKLPKK